MRSRARLVASALQLAALAALAACTALPTRPSSGAIEGVAAEVAPVSTKALSPAYATESARRKTAETVWQLVAERFYDPAMNGSDWPAARERYVPRAAAATNDAGFYRELKAMVGTLRDSHTQVLTPRETIDRRRFAAMRVGVLFAVIDGKVAIAEVDAGTPAAAAGIRAGDVVIALGRPDAPTRLDAEFMRKALSDPATAGADTAAGESARALPSDAALVESQRVLRAVQRLLRPLAASAEAPAKPMFFELDRGEAQTVRVTVAPERVVRPPTAQLRWLEGDVAVIRFTRFATELRTELDQALDAAARARAVIVDLRGNGGGLLSQYRWFAGQFFEQPAPTMRELRRDRNDAGVQRETEMRLGPGGNRTRGPLTQPLAVLVDPRTASAAELTAVTLREQRGAILVGEPTCGCVVAVPNEHVLPDGGGLRISETGFRSMRGARMEGEPTEPAVRVTPTLADLRAGRDVVLDTAHRRVLDRARGASAAVP
jgi:C-terminal processing protease CtpA/Prc